MAELPTAMYAYGVAVIAALATAVWSLGLGHRWRGSALAFAAYLLGQATALQLIYAGPSIHYEHYRPTFRLGQALDEPPWEGPLIGVLGLHSVVAAGLFFRYRGPIIQWIATHLGRRALLVVAVTAALAAFPSRAPMALGAEFALASLLRLTQLTYITVALLNLPQNVSTTLLRPIRRITEADFRPLGGVDPVALACALFAVVAASVLCLLSYQAHPHIPDEVGYYLQSRYFASGQMAVPAPQVPQAYEAYLVDCQAQACISVFPPGFPAVLALGQLVGLPFLVNPVVSGLNILLTFALLLRLYDRTTARLTVMLMAVSPWHLLMAMSFMSHTVSLCCALLAGLCTLRAIQDNRHRWLLPAGAAIGALSLTRPLEGLMAATVLGLTTLLGFGRIRLAPALLLGAATAATASLNGLYNVRFTGSPFVFPVMEYMEAFWGRGRNSLGFGPEKDITFGGLDPFPGHGLLDVLVNAQLNGTAIQLDLLGWSVGSLLPLLVFVALGRWRRPDFGLLLWIGTVIGTQSLYWFSGGPDFAARYWYTIIVPVLALTSRGLLTAEASLEPVRHDRSHASCAPVQPARGRLRPARQPGPFTLGAAAMSVTALLVFVPFRAVDKYFHFRGMQPGMRDLLASTHFGRGVILIRGSSMPDYASALVYGTVEPGEQTPLIFFDKDRPTRKALRAAYGDRPFYFVDGPTVTGRDYRLHSGPLRADAPWPDPLAEPALGGDHGVSDKSP